MAGENVGKSDVISSCRLLCSSVFAYKRNEQHLHSMGHIHLKDMY